MTVTTFGLIRHGLTPWNLSKTIQGQTDIELSEKGREQAILWARTLGAMKWDLVLASDLKRSRQTAELVNHKMSAPMLSDPRLKEQHWGEWQGRKLADINEEEPGSVEAQVARGWGFHPPGGESRTQVLRRARAALDQAVREHGGKKILVVTHRCVMACLTNDLKGYGFLPEEGKPIPGYDLYTIIHNGEGYFLSGPERSLDPCE